MQFTVSWGTDKQRHRETVSFMIRRGAGCYEITHLNLGVREGSLDKLIPRVKAK